MRITNKLIPVLAILVLSLWLTPARAADLEKRVVKARLDNGLTVLMLERKFSPTVSLYIRYRVGAVDETKGQTGAAHFLEHMMFKGTTTIGTKDFQKEKKILALIAETGTALDHEKIKADKADRDKIEKLAAKLKMLQQEHRLYYSSNEIDRLYTENGASGMNASTGQDITSYYVDLPANKIELWARIESDRLMNPVFREFYTERDVVMEEKRQRTQTSPDGKLYEAFMNEAYKVHPYGIPVLGTIEDIAYMNQDALRQIHEKYLNPQNIVIAVVGDIDTVTTLKLIDRYFGQLPKKQVTTPEITPEPPQKEERMIEVEFDANPSLIIGYHKPAPPAFDDYVFDVLETILTNGRTSRLYSSLVVTRQLADSIMAYNGIPASRYPNLFAISAAPRHPHSCDELLQSIYDEIENLKIKQIPDEELAKAKNQIKMSYLKSLDSNSTLASLLSYYELLMGDYRYFSGYTQQIDKVSASDLQQAAIRYLTDKNRTVAVLKKKAAPTNAPVIENEN
ncbi:MAG TPA: pitrilysin family protein [Smithellaceae bacterium]|nr:pitrilysin family protein [Smithellaceae bacterium]